MFPLEFPNALSKPFSLILVILIPHGAIKNNNIFSLNYYGSIKNSKWVREDIMKYKCGVLRMLMLSADSSKAGVSVK